MIRIYVFLLLLILLSSCKTQENSSYTASNNCYTAGSFVKLRDYINERIKFSGSGKFYVEYPPDKDWVDDGIKRPSNHPENVYNVVYEESVDQIHFENKKNKFIFLANDGLLLKKGRSNSDHDLGNKIYCYLLESAEKK